MTRWLLLTLHIEIDPGWSLLEEEEGGGGVSWRQGQKKRIDDWQFPGGRCCLSLPNISLRGSPEEDRTHTGAGRAQWTKTPRERERSTLTSWEAARCKQATFFQSVDVQVGARLFFLCCCFLCIAPKRAVVLLRSSDTNLKTLKWYKRRKFSEVFESTHGEPQTHNQGAAQK